MRKLHGGAAILGALFAIAAASGAQEVPCREFQLVLEEVPHVTLARRAGPLERIWSTEPPPACEVSFETTDSILGGAVVPIFLAEPGNETYRAGWRMIPEILADGAGSGVHGIQRNGVRCVIQWEHPAYIDDDGTLVQDDDFRMLIQCAGGP